MHIHPHHTHSQCPNSRLVMRLRPPADVAWHSSGYCCGCLLTAPCRGCQACPAGQNWPAAGASAEPPLAPWAARPAAPRRPVGAERTRPAPPAADSADRWRPGRAGSRPRELGETKDASLEGVEVRSAPFRAPRGPRRLPFEAAPAAGPPVLPGQLRAAKPVHPSCSLCGGHNLIFRRRWCETARPFTKRSVHGHPGRTCASPSCVARHDGPTGRHHNTRKGVCACFGARRLPPAACRRHPPPPAVPLPS